MSEPQPKTADLQIIPTSDDDGNPNGANLRVERDGQHFNVWLDLVSLAGLAAKAKAAVKYAQEQRADAALDRAIEGAMQDWSKKST
jgi:hypothetical protein